jgi:hypothetical protein
MYGKDRSMAESFYVGKLLDADTQKPSDTKVLFDPDNLTTHAVITGMTGSGKTGLGVAMVEESLLHNIPVLVLDPKGDLTNLLLHFPELRGEDFAPWVDPHTARRQDVSVEELAENTAATWKKGLAGWGLGQEQIAALKNAADYTIFTPGSSSGVPINVVSSFEAPSIPWEDNSEVLRSRIASTVTALLGLVGMHDIDPLRSREHILLSNLLENAWRDNQTLTMIDLITQIQHPPFDRLGAFPLDTFFNEKDRLELAMLLNNFLASPSFQNWTDGYALDFGTMLRSEDGRPRCNIFYLAHLEEDERMFFITLFFAMLESWMRTQRGTGHLRTLVYFDEVVGYLPPVSNPPSRELILRLLKQARAFGVGMVLATQNPVDVDYKALSNAGTWMIGRLQTERDIDRLMEGLRTAGSDLQPSEIRGKISGLPKRCFFFNSVHDKGAQIFHTRWVMNYLAGPLTRTQIPALNKMGGGAIDFESKEEAATPRASSNQPTAAAAATVAQPRAESPSLGLAAQSRKPVITGGLHEIFLPLTDSQQEAIRKHNVQLLPGMTLLEGVHYVPHFFMQFAVTINSRTYQVDHTLDKAYIAPQAPSVAFVDWSEYECEPVDPMRAVTPVGGVVTYSELPERLLPSNSLASFRNDMVDWLYRNVNLPILVNDGLKLYADATETEEEFQKRCREEAQQRMEAEAQKMRDKHEDDRTTLRNRIERTQKMVDDRRATVQRRGLETLGSAGELALSWVTKRRRSVSTTLSKQRMAQQAKDDLQQKELELRQLTEQWHTAEEDFTEQLSGLEEKWTRIAHDIREESLSPYKKDVINEVLGIAWMPCYVLEQDGKPRLVPAWDSSEKIQ